ncbi:MAG TPA: histidine phosphatase family protein [Rhizomicrobium sp.]|nr:histidine phosphatase family protein [Rhizomicrobium sp.]
MPDFRALTLYVLRHGECEHNVEGRIASVDDSPLTPKGRQQARANGERLKDLASDLAVLDFHASSLHRACVTMELMRLAAGLPQTGYRADHRLMEMNSGDQIWLKWSDISAWDHDAYRADPWNFARIGGENQAMVYERVGNFLGGLNRDAVIVTHQVPLRMIRGHYLGLKPEEIVRYAHPRVGIMRLCAGTESYFGD